MPVGGDRQGVQGAMTFWGPKVFRELFLLAPATADLIPGALTILTAIIGTIGGGEAFQTRAECGYLRN